MISTMVNIFTGLVIGAALVGAVCWSVLYFLFTTNPDRKWRNRVRRLLRAAQGAAEGEEYQLRHAERLRSLAEQELRKAAIQKTLRKTPVKELQRFHGVGPAMVSALRAGGFHGPLDILDRTINLHGFGAAKIDLVRRAALAMVDEVGEDIAQGRSPEGKKCQREIDGQRRSYPEEDARQRARLETIRKLQETMEEALVIARKVTLTKYMPDPQRSRLPGELLHKPLPDLQTALSSAELETDPDNLQRAAEPPPEPPILEQPQRARHLATLGIPDPASLTPDQVRLRYRELSGSIDLKAVRSEGREAVKKAAARWSELHAAAEALLAEFGETMGA